MATEEIQTTEMYGFPYPGFGGQSFGSKSSKSWYGTRFLKFNQSCMFSAVEHQKRCFSCSWMYIMQLTYILSRFPMPFWPLEPDAPLAFPTLLITVAHTTTIVEGEYREALARAVHAWYSVYRLHFGRSFKLSTSRLTIFMYRRPKSRITVIPYHSISFRGVYPW